MYGFCPGWCKTELTSGCANAPNTAYDGSKTAAHVLFEVTDHKGEFFYESKPTSIE